jgi:NAD(P)-dependent dehydrogenase (short-subunit alcohol dehydrogenase family)
MTNQPKIWLITGVSGGLGLALAKAAADAGDIVYGTLRNEEQFDGFASVKSGFTRPILMDVTQSLQIKAGVSTILKAEGRIDVLVNNAGYGLFGAIEEVSMDEARAQMETNFFGPLMLCKAVIPTMRKQQSGHILQISSMAGLTTAAGLGIYNASKHALEGYSGAMAKELEEFNIKVTCIEPGPFRTLWAGQSSKDAANTIEDYKVAAAIKRNAHANSGKQVGDPHKAALAMLTIVNSENPPLHLPLGASAYSRIRGQLENVANEVDAWEHVGLKTDFENM